MKAGVAISPDTPSTAITDEVAEAADMLLKLTVSAREIMVILKVAFKSGSSQHGNARLAAVGYARVQSGCLTA